MLIHLIAAARPNFMKIAPLYHALKKEDWADPILIHTGQHYDLNMSDAFFQDLGLPAPHVHLGVGSGTHAEQTAKVMIAYEKILLETHPDLVVVVGDVNSTIAATLAASKIEYPKNIDKKRLTSDENPISSIQNCPYSVSPQAERSSSTAILKRSGPQGRRRPLIAHLEAGLRSFDRTMPEEINRLVTDSLADVLWTPSPDADKNLAQEGIPKNKIHRVGNIMIDSLEMLRTKIENQIAYKDFGLAPGEYGLVTLHRPSNVDNPEILESICQTLKRVSKKLPLLFPVHPRTRKNLDQIGFKSFFNDGDGLSLIEPLNYIRFMNLVFHCRFAITDSGGIQEETTYLGIPCLTMRPNTERPITITDGTNQLCTFKNLESKIDQILSGQVTNGSIPEYWDGQTADRVVQSIKTIFN